MYGTYVTTALSHNLVTGCHPVLKAASLNPWIRVSAKPANDQACFDGVSSSCFDISNLGSLASYHTDLGKLDENRVGKREDKMMSYMECTLLYVSDDVPIAQNEVSASPLSISNLLGL